ncbi:hypothetical protein J4E93_004530 [Alternaria ventricosa]|uniref:uncharacterized protein n=1 Tax=Alternaria ventricosa TaxID=1187951 RepID=UPI0020C4E8D4|nr:uncharacterized protein J4E93_004530 [Alternaria ventricosa]KAI4648119.1 hypothetical protein J4E93_004530 [Alternaria ventricosa]
MLTKDQFVKGLEPLRCGICLDDYSTEHVPVQLLCGHIFGDHCIVEQVEAEMPNSNRCPLCRQELFHQENTPVYVSDESVFDEADDEAEGEEWEFDEERYQETLAGLLHDSEPGMANLASSDLKMLTDSEGRTYGLAPSVLHAETIATTRRERLNRQREFRLEHAERRQDERRTTVPKLPGRTRTYNQIEASDVETDADWSGSEYEPEEDNDPADECEE